MARLPRAAALQIVTSLKQRDAVSSVTTRASVEKIRKQQSSITLPSSVQLKKAVWVVFIDTARIWESSMNISVSLVTASIRQSELIRQTSEAAVARQVTVKATSRL